MNRAPSGTMSGVDSGGRFVTPRSPIPERPFLRSSNAARSMRGRAEMAGSNCGTVSSVALAFTSMISGSRLVRAMRSPMRDVASGVSPLELCPGSASPSPCPVGEGGLDRGTGVQCAQHGDRGNGGASKLGRDVVGDAGKAENINVQHLASSLHRFEILAAVVPQ